MSTIDRSKSLLSTSMLGLGLLTLVTACGDQEGRDASSFDRGQATGVGAHAIVVTPEMMELVIEWSEQDAGEAESLYDFLDEARATTERRAELPAEPTELPHVVKKVPFVQEIGQLEVALAEAQNNPQNDAGEGAGDDDGEVSCVTVFTRPEISHMPSEYESWNETEDLKSGKPKRGHLNYWGSRQGATSHSRFFLWGKRRRAEFERTDKESNFVRVVVQNLCLDADGLRVEGGEDATLHLHGSFNAAFYTRNVADGLFLFDRWSYAQAQAWAFFGYADNYGAGEAELTPLFDKSLELKRYTEIVWDREALHDLLEFGIEFGLGVATSGWSSALGDLAEAESAGDIADLFTATYINRNGEDNGSHTDVLRVDAGDLHAITLHPNVPKVVLLHQTFGHYGKIKGNTTESVSEITTDYAMLGMIERTGDAKPVGFYAFGSHDEFEPERTTESIRAFVPTWFTLAGWPVEDPEASAALDELRQPLAGDGLTHSGVLVY